MRKSWSRWTSQEIAFLQNNINKMNYDELSLSLQKDRDSVINKASSLGLTKRKERPKKGDRFERLVVEETFKEYNNNGSKNREYCWCQCDCKSPRKKIRTDSLLSGKIVSCGCYHKEEATTHGDSKSILYEKHRSMLKRCSDKGTALQRKYYYEKGIRVCEEWYNYEKFKEWALSTGYKDNLTIERKDNSKGYSPENCIWIESSEQAKNKTNANMVTAFGETKSATEWINDERCAVGYTTLLMRLKSNMNPEDAIVKPSRQKRAKQ